MTTPGSTLVSRQTGGIARPSASDRTDALMARARQLATAPKEMLPKHYRDSPGACLLAVDWAERYDVSILEAVGEVAFVYGKAVVSAVMQKRLAARLGYETREVDKQAGESSTVAVFGPDGAEVGRFTYTLELANSLGINKGDVWRADPAQMLYKRATTRALERYGPSGLAPIMAEEDPDNDTPSGESAPGSPPGLEVSPVVTNRDRPEDSSTVEGQAGPLDPASPRERLDAAIAEAGIKPLDVAKHWRLGLDQIAEDVEVLAEVLAWLPTAE